MAAVSARKDEERQPTRHACECWAQSASTSASQNTAAAPIAPPALPLHAASSPKQLMYAPSCRAS
eukprot:2977414-Rhodomonas_salina.1